MEKKTDGDGGTDVRWGWVGRRGTECTDKCHRLASKAVTPVRKGRAAEGESKNEQDELVKMA
jgi:hypothetical protein